MLNSQRLQQLVKYCLSLALVAFTIDFVVDGQFDIPLMLHHSILSLQHGTHILGNLELVGNLFFPLSLFFFEVCIVGFMFAMLYYLGVLLCLKRHEIKHHVSYFFILNFSFEKQYLTIKSAITPVP